MGLKAFIERNPGVITQLFPTKVECQISASEFKEKINVDDPLTGRNQAALDFLYQYMDNLQGREKGTEDS